MTEILILCTANICRSPMAAAFLARQLAGRGVAARVRSAGMLGGDLPAPAEVVAAMAGHGLDVTGHRSRQLTPADLGRADLILAMACEHLRHAVVTAPDIWPRAFTARELVRRGERAGGRAPGEALPQWLARVHDGRSRLALLGDSPQDDVGDPMGGPLAGYEQAAADLRKLAGRLADLCWPAPAPPGGLAAGGGLRDGS
jgi:protein-tyrosine phosphatase